MIFLFNWMIFRFQPFFRGVTFGMSTLHREGNPTPWNLYDILRAVDIVPLVIPGELAKWWRQPSLHLRQLVITE